MSIVDVVPDESFEEASKFVDEFIVELLLFFPNCIEVLQFYCEFVIEASVALLDAFLQHFFINFSKVKVEVDDIFYSLGFSFLLRVKISSILKVLIFYKLVVDVAYALLDLGQIRKGRHRYGILEEGS